ncbi:multiheme c-type cytochrome [Maribacter halichondriae]|uniref:multiheme c-type cytochrome n=1 Tax=Maribacter halichondriae TaxID=2980554 RepID=UPI002359040B|nr:multiheme c-type cytochrome [Maribacter sp. Hal144]
MVKSIVFSAVLLVVSFILYFKYFDMEADYYSPPILATHYNGAQFVGSNTCIECHADIYKTHIETAHYNTSALADSATVKGSFEKGLNTLDLNDVIFEMVQESGALYQHTTIKNRNVQIPPAKFDIVIGSGVRGQTYLTWKDDKLFQLQPSYHTPSDNWINSPGYPSYYLERPIRDACLKCHVTFAENKDFSGQGNEYSKEQIVYGVDCEKCHGPLEKHVSYHKNNKVETPKFVMQFDTLSRLQRLDVCAQCHSGLRSELIKGKSFSFLPGENLNEYSRNVNEETNATLDVHGNQYGLLTQSECFKQSANMDCMTCHDPHKNQRDNASYFNKKCIGCHSLNTVVCTEDNSKVQAMGNNCIACHMPITPSKTMMAQLKKDSLETSFYIRTHLIGVYPE